MYGNFYLGKRKWRKGGHGQHKKSPTCRNSEAERDLRSQINFGGNGQTQRTLEINRKEEWHPGRSRGDKWNVKKLLLP